MPGTFKREISLFGKNKPATEDRSSSCVYNIGIDSQKHISAAPLQAINGDGELMSEVRTVGGS